MEAQELRTYRFTLHPEGGFGGRISVVIEACDEKTARKVLHQCVSYAVEYRDATAQVAACETACYHEGGTLEEKAALRLLDLFLCGQGERSVADLWRLADKAKSVATRFARGKRETQNEDPPPSKKPTADQWAKSYNASLRPVSLSSGKRETEEELRDLSEKSNG